MATEYRDRPEAGTTWDEIELTWAQAVFSWASLDTVEYTNRTEP